MVHAHHCYPYLSTSAPKTTKCLEEFVSCLFACLKVASRQKMAFSAKNVGIGKKKFRRPASSGQNAGWRVTLAANMPVPAHKPNIAKGSHFFDYFFFKVQQTHLERC